MSASTKYEVDVNSDPIRTEDIEDAESRGKEVLALVQQISLRIQEARSLRHQKSSLLSTAEKTLLDQNILRYQNVVFIESNMSSGARAELAKSSERRRYPATGIMSAMREHTRLRSLRSLRTILARLLAEKQDLDRDIVFLSNRMGMPKSVQQPTIRTRDLLSHEVKPPPRTREEIMFYSEGRQRNHRRQSNIAPTTKDVPPAYPVLSTMMEDSELIAAELSAEEGFGPVWDRARHESARLTDEVFFETYSDVIDIDGEGERERSRAVGRRRGLNWLESRASEKS